METLPEPRQRPAFAQFLWDRGVSHRVAAAAIERSHEYVRRICLPFGDPKRTVPDQETMRRIEAYTCGAITEKDFAEPELTEALP